MTDEQGLDRSERIVKLMIKAGLSARGQVREPVEQINILIDRQIRNEELFAANQERVAANEERFKEQSTENDKRFAALAEAQAEVARSQAETGAQLKAFIATVDRVPGSRDNGGA